MMHTNLCGRMVRVSNWLRNGKQVVKRTGVVGNESCTERLVVEPLRDIETSNLI